MSDADARDMLASLRADAALLMDLANYFMARDTRECPCCEERGGTREDGLSAMHAPWCRLSVRVAAIAALLDKHGRG